MAGKKAKGNRVQVILECTEMKESGLPGTSRYITTKNRKNTPERMELKKYNPILKRMTVHKEIRKPSLPSTKAQRMVALTQRLSRWLRAPRLVLTSSTSRWFLTRLLRTSLRTNILE